MISEQGQQMGDGARVAARSANAALGGFFGWAIAALLIALLLSVGVAWAMLNPPAKDLQDLSVFLLISGGISVILGAIGFRLGLGTRVPSLAVSVALVYLVGVAVVGVNVIYTAANMFFSREHDLPLLTVLLLFSAVISLFFASFMAHSMVSRLSVLLSMARRVADGDMSARVDVTSRDEIGQLTQEFNSMVERLRESQEQRARLEMSRRELVAAVSHDLRTPLASMRAMIEALNDGVVADADTVQRYLRTIGSETQHLATLIDDLFELSQIDAGALTLHLEPTSLADMVSDALESMRAQAEQKRVKLEGHVDGEPQRVPLDAPKMQRVLYNLIQNAIRHTPPDGTIALTVRDDDDCVALTVADTGEGIPESDMPHIFDNFYRGERARTRERDVQGRGAGLGLAIARGIVEAHGGSITATSASGQGSVFQVMLPAAGRSMR